MENNASERKTTSANNQIHLIIFGILLFNAVYSAYVLNYKPKIGAYHIRICSALGLLLTVFTVWGFIRCVGLLKKREGKKGVNITVLILLVSTFILCIDNTLPYYKDLIGNSKTVTTDSYLIVHDNLYFLDDNGEEVRLTIPQNTANDFRSKENYEYDSANNLLKYYDKISVTYFPNSKVIISTLAED